MPRRKKSLRLPTAPISVRIESYCHDGRGLTHLDGRVTFVDGALAGEVVELVYSDIRRDFAEAKTIRVIEPSPLRADPKCEYFGVCGGCTMQHVESARQVEIKQLILDEQLRRIAQLRDVPIWPALRGPAWGYRHKARLSVKYVRKKGRALVGFNEKATHLVADIAHCEVLHPRVGNKLAEIAQLVTSLSIRDRIPQVEIAVSEDELCTLVFRHLTEPSSDDLAQFREFAKRHDFAIYLQSGGPESISSVDARDSSAMTYSLPRHDLKLTFEVLQFSQVNIEINRLMVDRALELLAPKPGDRVIDLYCGIGNFTLPIARSAQQATGIEGHREMIEQARKNAIINGLTNVRFEVADLNADVSEQDWCKQRYNLALLDPSRAGAEAILKYFPRWGVERVVYVSCNPATLARDAAILVHTLGYRILGAGVMDMFPQTSHIESIALFEKPFGNSMERVEGRNKPLRA